MGVLLLITLYRAINSLTTVIYVPSFTFVKNKWHNTDIIT